MLYFILFSNRLIDERSRDHYRELNREQNIEFDEEHLKIIDILSEAKGRFCGNIYHAMKNKGHVFLVDGSEAPLRQLYKALIAKLRS